MALGAKLASEMDRIAYCATWSALFRLAWPLLPMALSGLAFVIWQAGGELRELREESKLTAQLVLTLKAEQDRRLDRIESTLWGNGR